MSDMIAYVLNKKNSLVFLKLPIALFVFSILSLILIDLEMNPTDYRTGKVHAKFLNQLTNKSKSYSRPVLVLLNANGGAYEVYTNFATWSSLDIGDSATFKLSLSAYETNTRYTESQSFYVHVFVTIAFVTFSVLAFRTAFWFAEAALI